MKRCFTINPMRTDEDFIGYKELLKNNVYQAIEIFYPYNLDEEKKEKYTKNVKELKNEFPNIEVVMHLPYGKQNSLCDFSNCLENINRIKDAIDYTSQFKTKKLTLHLGDVNKNIDRSIYVKHIINVLNDLCSYVEKYNMNIMIENMPSDYELGYSPNELLEIITSVNKDNLKFILDTGHAHVSDYQIDEYIYDLKDYLFHMHFSDNSGKSDEHKRIGLGTIDFSIVFAALKKIKYNELLCMEVIFSKPLELVLFASDLDKYDKN